MRSIRLTILFLLLLLPLWSIKAQEKAENETDIHNNVRLVEMPIPPDLPEEFKAKYQTFMQQLKTALSENTKECEEAGAITFQVSAGIKEIGLNRTKRPMARIVAFKKDSRSEFSGDLLLHSYLTGDTVNKQEIETFLQRQILNPLGSL
jgi:hypothetical protein